MMFFVSKLFVLIHTIVFMTLLSYGSSGSSPLLVDVKRIKKQSSNSPSTDTHNKYRNQLAKGDIPGFPSSESISELQLDLKLTLESQKWASYCKFEHSHGSGYGENLYYITAKIPFEKVIGKATEAWWKEYSLIKNARFPLVLTEKLFNRGVGHFTQMIWAKTTHVGCGSWWCPDKGYTLVVCRYSPPGNMIGDTVYKPSSNGNKGCQSDSSCQNELPKSTCNKSSGLCNPKN